MDTEEKNFNKSIKRMQMAIEKKVINFGLRHIETARAYKRLNKKIGNYQTKKIIQYNNWLAEAIEQESENMPNTRHELKVMIDELRSRLFILADFYGYRSKEALTYSQFLDIFIVQYQKLH